MPDQRRFTLEQAMNARKVLRDSMNLQPEMFPLDGVIGMLSDEIEVMRKAGTSDAMISKLIGIGLGDMVLASDVRAYFVPTKTPERQE